MSYRIEEKLLIDNNSILEFKNYLSSKTAKQIYQPRIIESLYFENNKREMYSDSIEGLSPEVQNYLFIGFMGIPFLIWYVGIRRFVLTKFLRNGY